MCKWSKGAFVPKRARSFQGRRGEAAPRGSPTPTPLCRCRAHVPAPSRLSPSLPLLSRNYVLFQWLSSTVVYAKASFISADSAACTSASDAAA